MLRVWTRFLNLMGADYYAAHAICLLYDPVILTMYIASNETIAISYYVIGGLLMWTYVFEHEVKISFQGSSALLFGAFIFLCGLSHTAMDITLFSGVYRLDVIIRMLTAGVSAVTAFKLVVDKLDAVASRR